MAINPLAGKPAPADILIDVGKLERDYFERKPDTTDPTQLVSFGTSGHRGTSVKRHFHRSAHPRHHAGDLRIPRGATVSPARSSWARTPMLSLTLRSAPRSKCWRPMASKPSFNRETASRLRLLSRTRSSLTTGRIKRLSDGIVVTPSHNPPEDGGFKYNPPDGGPADTGHHRLDSKPRERTSARRQSRCQTRIPASSAMHQQDFVASLRRRSCRNVIDMDVIRSAGLKIGVDPLGGSSLPYWQPIADRYGLEHHGRESESRSALRLHDCRSRRQDSHGLLQPLRDGRSR